MMGIFCAEWLKTKGGALRPLVFLLSPLVGAVLAWYDRNDPVCAQLLRLRYLQGLSEEKVIARLYVGRTTYYTKELEALSTVAVCAADAGLLPGGQMSGVF